MKIIILNKTPYQEKDVIMNAVNEDGCFSFTIKSGASEKSPFKWLNNPLTVAEVEFVEPNIYKYPILKRADLIKSPMTVNQNFNQMMAVNAVSEMVLNMLQEDEREYIFNDIISFLEYQEKPNADVLLQLMIFLARCMKYAGFDIDVNHCVRCGEKENIVAFSFEEGGFVCKKCLDSSINCDLTANQMKLLRFVFKTDQFVVNLNGKVNEEDEKILLAKMNAFVDDIVGVQIESINMLLK